MKNRNGASFSRRNDMLSAEAAAARPVPPPVWEPFRTCSLPEMTEGFGTSRPIGFFDKQLDVWTDRLVPSVDRMEIRIERTIEGMGRLVGRGVKSAAGYAFSFLLLVAGLVGYAMFQVNRDPGGSRAFLDKVADVYNVGVSRGLFAPMPWKELDGEMVSSRLPSIPSREDLAQNPSLVQEGDGLETVIARQISELEGHGRSNMTFDEIEDWANGEAHRIVLDKRLLGKGLRYRPGAKVKLVRYGAESMPDLILDPGLLYDLPSKKSAPVQTAQTPPPVPSSTERSLVDFRLLDYEE
ncbi:hypothetical protein HYV73_03025 [Candidatus Uhrbacteria bacterium]|nr:hypothetical protein [Candidatus Uhrbacteria bacterium]